MRDTLFALL